MFTLQLTQLSRAILLYSMCHVLAFARGHLSSLTYSHFPIESQYVTGVLEPDACTKPTVRNSTYSHRAYVKPSMRNRYIDRVRGYERKPYIHVTLARVFLSRTV